MKHITWANRDSYETALLIKESALQQAEIEKHYIEPLEAKGYSRDNIICFSLHYDSDKKVSAKTITKYLLVLTKALTSQGVQHLLVCDSHYFKSLTKVKKVAPVHGYVCPVVYDACEHMTATICPNYQALFHNPDEVQPKIELALDTTHKLHAGTYEDIGMNIIEYAAYPDEPENIRLSLQELHRFTRLTVDIETYGLNFWETGIATVSFAWNQHEGIAFRVDNSKENKKNLKAFFEHYNGQLIWHNASFDLKIIIHDLFMKNPLDEVGKQYGIKTMTRNMLDTKIMSYVCTNSTAGNNLSLKHQAHEFAGNWAQDVSDITQIHEEALLQYNLIDALSTYYVFNKHEPDYIKQHAEWYNYPLNVSARKEPDWQNPHKRPWIGHVLHDSIAVLLQMELTGMPINMRKVSELRASLEAEQERTLLQLKAFPLIQSLEHKLTQKQWTKDFLDRAEKAKNPEKIERKDWEAYCEKAWVTFNPNSTTHLSVLLYDLMNLPVLDKTDTGLPACGAKTLKKLKHHTIDEGILGFLDALVKYSDAGKILNTFVTAFEGAVKKKDGWHYLHGNFNLGGTVSGRLSSSGPNLQNIPSGKSSAWSKEVKNCFQAPPGYLFVGADFASLEDRISALTTRDKNKLKVYEDGFDGHSLRAYSYFGDQMPDIDPSSVESINSIGDKYPDLRDASKGPTFLCTYGGTWMGMVDQFGFTPDEAKRIEASYHKLYKQSDDWVAGKITEATDRGYVEVAFGLRIRTPLLKQVLWGDKKTPYEALKEGRTAGNALGQSYGLLNNRAGIEFQKRCFRSAYAKDIVPVAHIHDAQYFIIRDDIEVVEYVSKTLSECMAWQELPELRHPIVKLKGDLDIFYPNWANRVELNSSMNQADIMAACAEHLEKMNAPEKVA